jgi:N-acetylmuramoyl-L-alanine amidase
MAHPRRIGTSVLAVLALLRLAGPLQAAAETAEHGQKQPVAPTCDRAQFRVALDVGHTAEAPGAISARGAPEYEFNLRLATLIEQDLIAAGFGKTILLVTDGPAQPGLVKRVTAANNASADLFLAIHHDSVPDSMLEDWEYEGKPSHFSDRFKGHSIFVSYDNPHLKESLQFGRLLGRQLKDRGLQYATQYTQEFMGRHRRELIDADVGVYRYDQLVVLRSTEMPAVLLEAGSIINRDEELAMATPERQALIVAAVSNAVEAFCASRPPRPRTAHPTATEAAKPAGSPAVLAPLLNLFKRP